MAGSGTKPVLQVVEAAQTLENGQTLFVGGSGGGIQEPTALLGALARIIHEDGCARGTSSAMVEIVGKSIMARGRFPYGQLCHT